MKSLVRLCIFYALVVPTAATDSTPVQKVIELLNGMVAKGKKDKSDEVVQFAAYKTFCENTNANKETSIAESTEKIATLKADIEKRAATIRKLAKSIEVHEGDEHAWRNDKKAVDNVRGLEKAAYDASHKDYSESVDALKRAIKVLKDEDKDTPQAASLVQVSMLKLVPDDVKATLNSFLQARSEADPNAYEFQSGGVVNLLDELLDKFVAEKTEIEKKEQQSKGEHEKMATHLSRSIDRSVEQQRDENNMKTTNQEKKARSEKEQIDEKAVKASDETYKDDLVATCEQKAADFKSRQDLRAEELEAVQKAIEILGSGTVSGNSEKHLHQSDYSKAAMLAQLRGNLDKKDQEQAASYLRARASQLNSRVLQSVANHMVGDPFVKVRKLIQDLITRLMEEANQEAEHKGWCDTELTTNVQTRTDKTTAVEVLTADLDMLTASIADLGRGIAEHSSAIADLDSASAKATDLRQKESDKNAETIKDAKEAQEAVAQALIVLKEFYNKAGEATALVQGEPAAQPEAPEIFDSPYTGMSDNKGGVVGMLEVIQSDFARLETDTQAAEEAGKAEHTQFMAANQKDKAVRNTDLGNKQALKQDQEQTKVAKQNDVEGNQRELNAANDYWEKLKKSCVETGVSHEDRVARREEEIESLQEALRILNGEELA